MPPIARALRLVPLAALAFALAVPAARAGDASTRDVDFAREQVYPALVNIGVVSREFSGGRIERYPSAGSGVIVSPAGHVVTNYHVAGDSDHLTCRLPSKEEIDADVVAHDPLTDISILKLRLDSRKDRNAPIPFAKIGDSSRLEVGEPVLAMGNPLTLSSSMTLGIVGNPARVFTSFTGSDMDELDLGEGQVTGLFTAWIQHDALILPGNSGGPLVNLRGEVVGINELGGGGVGFAIPSNLIKNVLNQALAYGEVRRGWFGVTVQPVERLGLKQGALVSSVQPGGPAEKAGIAPGDVLWSFDGESVAAVHFEEIPAVYKRMADYEMGRVLKVAVRTDGKERVVDLVVAKMERYLDDEHEIKNLGLSVRGITGPMALMRRYPDPHGVLVTGVRPGFPASDAKPTLSEGDVIRELDGKAVTNYSSFQSLADGLGRKAGIAVRVRRGNDDVLTVLDTSKKPPESFAKELPKAWLGVRTQVVTPDVATAIGAKDLRGFRITQVFAATEAEKAGLKVGDVLTGMNGSPLKAAKLQDGEMLVRLVEALTPGEKAEFDVVRGDAKSTVSLTLEPKPLSAAEAKDATDSDLEYKVREIVFDDRVDNRWSLDQKGVVVTEVTSGGWAYIGGLQGGDLILEMQREKVEDVVAFEALVKRLKETKPALVTFFVRRGYKTHFVFVPVDRTEKK